jgi:hypothetical protein
MKDLPHEKQKLLDDSLGVATHRVASRCSRRRGKEREAVYEIMREGLSTLRPSCLCRQTWKTNI